MKLKGIEIEAFRGYQNKVYFDFLTKQGLIADIVVIFAPNGFGKTSFFDAVEWGLKDKINRFESKILTNAAESEKEVLSNRNTEKRGVVSYIDSQDMSLTKKVKTTVKWDLGPGVIDKSSNSVLKNYFPVKEKKQTVVEILPQNAVDEFVFSTSPEDRYRALTGFWDGEEDTKYFQGVSELVECHNEEVEAQRGRIGKTKELIAQFASSEGQISRFNEIISDINALKVSKSKFDEVDAKSIDSEEKFDQLKADYVHQFSQYQGQISQNQIEVDKISLLQSDHAKYALDVLDIDKIEKQIEKFKHTLNQFKQEAEFNSDLQAAVKKTEEWAGLLHKLKTLAESRDSYLENLNAQKKHSVERTNLVADNIDLANQVQAARKVSFESVKSQNGLKSKSDKAKEDNIYLNRNLTLFSRNLEIVAHSRSRLALCQKLLERKMSKLFEVQSQELGYKTQIGFSAEDLLRNVQGSSALELTELRKVFEQIPNIRKRIEEKEAQFFKTGSLSDNLQKIVEFGRSYVAETMTSSCPLCASTFGSFASLLAEIEKQKNDVLGLESLQAQIEIAKSELASSQVNLATELEAVRKILRKHEIEVHLKVVDAQKAEQGVRNLIKYYQDQQSLANQDMESIQRSVDRKLTDSESMKTVIEDNEYSISNWEKQLSDLKTQETDSNALLQRLTQKLNVQRDRIEQLDTLIQSLSSEHVFVQTEEILQEVVLDEAFDSIDLAERISRLENDLIEFNKSNQKVQEQLADLRNKLTGQKETEVRHVLTSLRSRLMALNAGVQAYDLRFNELARKHPIKVDEDLLEPLGKLKLDLEKKATDLHKITTLINELLGHLVIIEGNLNLNIARIKLAGQEDRLIQLLEISVTLESIRGKVRAFIDSKVNKVFNQHIINDIYQKIDPHPELKNIKLDLDFTELKPKLTIRAKNLDGTMELDPVLYLSSAQINILSLSIFLAKALQNNRAVLDTIFMDDPIQYLDSINILSFMDLLRVIISRNGINRQLIISTHDAQFFRLLKKKFDPEYYLAKFIEFETYGSPKESRVQ